MTLKLPVTVLALLLGAPLSAAAEDVSVEVSLTPWFASWQQQSTAADRFGSDAINVNYAIEDSIAYDAGLQLGYGGFFLSVDSISQSETVNSRDNKLSYSQIGLRVVDALPGVTVDIQQTRGAFEGFIDGAANNGNTGTGTFESDLTLRDLSVLFYHGFGLGIRQVDYELPQDLYLVNRSDPNNALLAGFQEVSYSGNFIQLVAVSADYYSTDSDQTSGFSYIARYGSGKLDPGGSFLADTETLLRDNGQLAAGERIMEEGDSSFAELDISFYRRYHWLGGQILGRLGYRYTRWKAEFGSDSDYQLVTDFETTFDGPYLGISGRF